MAENKKKGLLEVFLAQGKRGFYIGVEVILPSMILAYVIIAFLQLTGLINILSYIFSPIMGLFGLPGEGVAVSDFGFPLEGDRSWRGYGDVQHRDSYGGAVRCVFHAQYADGDSCRTFRARRSCR